MKIRYLRECLYYRVPAVNIIFQANLLLGKLIWFIMTNLKIAIPVLLLMLKSNSPIALKQVCNPVYYQDSSNSAREKDSELVASDFRLKVDPGSNKLTVSAMITNNTKDMLYVDLYAIFKDQNKKLLPIEGFASGNFLTKQDGNIKYSAILPFSVKAATTVEITISLNPSGKLFQPGNYQMDIYAKGEKIGSGHFHLG
jgi:hypothetical protein